LRIDPPGEETGQGSVALLEPGRRQLDVACDAPSGPATKKLRLPYDTVELLKLLNDVDARYWGELPDTRT
jgi:hypothetical protein